MAFTHSLMPSPVETTVMTHVCLGLVEPLFRPADDAAAAVAAVLWKRSGTGRRESGQEPTFKLRILRRKTIVSLILQTINYRWYNAPCTILRPISTGTHETHRKTGS